MGPRRAWLIPVLPVILLALWYVYTAHVPGMLYYPRPAKVLAAFQKLALSGDLPTAVATSIGRVLTGFCLASLTAGTLGLLMGYYRTMESAMDPLIESCRPIAPIALLPLAILWFGTGTEAAVFIVSYAAFFPMVLNTVAAVRQVDVTMVKAARTFGASPWNLLRQVILPGALPTMLVGSRLAMGSSWTSVVAAELAVGAKAGGGGTGGIGQMMFTFYLYQNDPNPIVACMITVGVVGFLLDRGVRAVSLWLVPWSHRGA